MKTTIYNKSHNANEERLWGVVAFHNKDKGINKVGGGVCLNACYELRNYPLVSDLLITDPFPPLLAYNSYELHVIIALQLLKSVESTLINELKHSFTLKFMLKKEIVISLTSKEDELSPHCCTI